MAILAGGLGSAAISAGAGAVLSVIVVLAGTNVAMNASSPDKPAPSNVSAATVGYADA